MTDRDHVMRDHVVRRGSRYLEVVDGEDTWTRHLWNATRLLEGDAKAQARTFEGQAARINVLALDDVREQRREGKATLARCDRCGRYATELHRGPTPWQPAESYVACTCQLVTA